MAALNHDELRRRTLQRQFPSISGRDQAAVLELFGRLGPIQTQVPRAPFLVASSRLPGAAYADVNGLFADHRLVKTSSIRGTVHTSTADAYARLDPVARLLRATQLRTSVELGAATPEDVFAELERHCADDWVAAGRIVAHIGTGSPSQRHRAARRWRRRASIWGHSGLLRRPRDEHWERRTDALPPNRSQPCCPIWRCSGRRRHWPTWCWCSWVRTARSPEPTWLLLRGRAHPGGPRRSPDWATLSIGFPGRTARPTWNWPNHRRVATPRLGVRLLPEFDGLLLGFAGPNRTRFCTVEQLSQIWAKVNGLYAPVVLRDDRWWRPGKRRPGPAALTSRSPC